MIIYQSKLTNVDNVNVLQFTSDGQLNLEQTLIIVVQCCLVWFRYGPNSSRLQDKLFKGSKTDMYFAEGKTFVASRSKAGCRDNERLFMPGAKKCAAEAMAELREKRGGVSCKKGVVTQEGSDIL